GIVGAAPPSRPVAFPVSFCGSASCFDGEGLVAAAFAVLVSAGGGSDFARAVPAALCPRFAAEAAGFDFGAEASAGWRPPGAAPWASGLGAHRLVQERAAAPAAP